MKLKCDGPLSNFAFNFNLRRYNVVCWLLKGCVTDPDEIGVELDKFRTALAGWGGAG